MEESKDNLSKHYKLGTDRVFTPLDELREDAAMTDELQEHFYDVDELIANLENYDDWPTDPKKRVFGKKYIKKGKIVEAVVGKRGTSSKSTIEQTVIDSHIKNNAKYKYPIQEYINGFTKIEIICPIHGSFWQRADDHLSGRGCPTCGVKKRADQRRNTLDDVRNKIGCCSNGEKYTIPDQEYINTNTKIEIICPIHGSFWQTPNDHLRGMGCNKCGFISSAKKNRGSLDDVRKKSGCCANGKKYTIPDQEYVNTDTQIEIICPIHGSFKQTPHDHLSGKGCNKCGFISSAKKNRGSLDDVRKKSGCCANGKKYIIPDQEYVNTKTQIEIICPIHGSFWQRAGDHMKGCGCSNCKNKTEGKLYLFLRSKLSKYMIKQQKKYDWCRNPETGFYLPFDYLVLKKILIELDGDQHIDKQILNWVSPEEQQERDMYKMEQAINNGKHVIRILQRDVWNDTNDWKEKLIQAITELKDITDPTIRCIGDCAVYKEYAVE